ncbi:hypothetical protein BH09MYX1_BH09MYX1_44020 [soil metagenome]
MRWVLGFVVGVAAFACARPGLAQVNAEALRANSLSPGWSGGVDLSLALSRGNIELFDPGGAGRIQYQTIHPRSAIAPGPLPWIYQRTFITTSGRFAERTGVPQVSQGFLFGRWTALWHPRVGHDMFVQYQFNEFLRLRRRSVFGAGVRVEIVHHPMVLLAAGTGAMLEYERIDVAPGANDAPTSIAVRSASYVTVRLSLFKSTLFVQNTLFVQPRFDQPDDIRVLDELELLAKVSDFLALGTTLSTLYDSAPPTGVVTTDLRLASTVRLTF